MSDPEIDAIRAELTAHPRPAGLAERRQRMDGLATRFPVAPDVEIQTEDAGGVPAEWTVTPGADPTRIVMFLHGGGYITGSIVSHRHMVAQAGREARARTFAIDYRLAPEHPFPAALDDTLAAYRHLLAQGHSPARMAFAGEAAGGGLVLAALVALRDAGDPLPSCAWVASPWVDLEMTGKSMESKAASDSMTPKPYLQELAGMYLGGGDPRAPLASPLHADLAGLPPLLIQVGSTETLLDDAVRLAGAAGAADVRIALEVWPDMLHGWHLFYQRLAAGKRALARAGEFIRSNTE